MKGYRAYVIGRSTESGVECSPVCTERWLNIAAALTERLVFYGRALCSSICTTSRRHKACVDVFLTISPSPMI